jgi:hypothetical protein
VGSAAGPGGLGMFKYLIGAAVGALGLYGVQQVWAVSSAGPDLKVWVGQTHIPPNNDPYDVLYVQSREDEPIVLKRVIMNDDPKCVNMDASTYRADTPVRLGEVFRFALGIHGLNACQPVRVVIATDRG